MPSRWEDLGGPFVVCLSHRVIGDTYGSFTLSNEQKTGIIADVFTNYSHLVSTLLFVSFWTRYMPSRWEDLGGSFVVCLNNRVIGETEGSITDVKHQK